MHHRHGRVGFHSHSSHDHVTIRQRLPCLQSIPEHDQEDIEPFRDRSSGQLSSKQAIRPSSLPPLCPRNGSIVKSFLDMEDVTPLELVNLERRRRTLPPFRLSRTLNTLASQQASKMALKGTVYHSASTIDELKMMLAGTEVAENIQCGASVLHMHMETMRQLDCINRSNVLSKYFSEFGYGIALGADGRLFCCQLFRS
jgi:Cysteine-rich secretory protein family